MVNQKPGPRYIFLPDTAVLPLAESLVALANSDGGLIILGVDGDGRPTTEIWEEEAELALREAAALCLPPVPSHFQSVELPSGRFIGIQVPRSLELHSLADGRVLVRRRDENRPLSGEEIRSLAVSRPSVDFETEPVPGAKPDDLDTETLKEYLEKREARTGIRAPSVARLMNEIGATDKEGVPTLIGLLLFGRNPQAYLPQSGVVFVNFPITEPRGEDGGIGYGRRDELTGSLARIIERAWAIVFDEMRVGATVNGLQREELLEYPRFAVREALVNAVAHRDYRITGRRIELRMYADRLEIISPGGLPGYKTVDNLVDEHF
jgi:ATP-dependent DNA helicase RecG